VLVCLCNRTVRCTKHYWKLNVATMEYVNPPDSFMQDELGKIIVIYGIFPFHKRFFIVEKVF